MGLNYEATMAKELISLTEAMASLPVKVSRTTGWRWLERYPALERDDLSPSRKGIPKRVEK